MKRWGDRIAGAMLLLLIACTLPILMRRASSIDPAAYDPRAMGYWYGADLGAALSTQSEWLGMHLRSDQHPLFTLLTFPLVAIVQAAFHRSSLTAALDLQFVALAGLLWAFHALLRRVGCVSLDALLGSALLASASAVMLWAVVLGTSLWGALSSVVALLLLTPAAARPLGQRRLVAAGLIAIVKMENHFPVAYVTASTFGGLAAAARLAERSGHAERAVAWRSRAVRVQRGWTELSARSRWQRRWHFIRSMAWPQVLAAMVDDPRGTLRALDPMFQGYVCFECDVRYDSAALWPFGVGAPIENSVRSRVQAHRAAIMTGGEYRTRPDWPYFDLQLAHQLLWVGDRAGAWTILQWFFDHQLAPGLYTWGEGRHETNGPGAWDEIRGWLDAGEGVTPHYWAAAEMLLLQLDMLVHVTIPPPDRPHEPPRVEIGRGVPAAWLARSLGMAGLATRAGTVCWRWDLSQLIVTVPNESIEVQGMGAFADKPLVRRVGACQIA